MPSMLMQRALTNIADDGFARAKKLAALAIKTNTDAKGSPTARGYKQALDLLTPYIQSSKGTEAIDAQALMAGYNNNLDSLNSKSTDQNQTVSAFKSNEDDAYFTSFDGDVGGMRDPASLVNNTSESLDNLVIGVMGAIKDKTDKNEPTDQLESYLNDLQGRADQMRDLKNRFNSGELAQGQDLNGFGYYVDTNPIDGSVRRAAIIPVDNPPPNMTTGFKRLNATATVGNGYLPVYAPAQTDATGQSVARIGTQTWSGTGTAALESDQSVSPGQFSISNKDAYPSKPSTAIDNGNFGAGLVGQDAQGKPVYGMVYKGTNGQVYQIDDATLAKMKTDPILGAKLGGYIQRYSPTDMAELTKDALPISSDYGVEKLSAASEISGLQQNANVWGTEQNKLLKYNFFGNLSRNTTGIVNDLGNKMTKTLAQTDQSILNKPSIISAPKGNEVTEDPNAATVKNVASKMVSPSIYNSVSDIVDKGKQFFRSVVGK